MNKKPSFAIVSGAGPMAGKLLYELCIEQLQKRGAWRDGDFPSILLHNVPFSPMLDGHVNHALVYDELIQSLKFLSKHSDYIYIACQTLHAFLSTDDIKNYKIVSLLELTREYLKDFKETIYVIASKTSRVYALHNKGLQRTCNYCFEELAEKSIDNILKGKLVDLSPIELFAKNNLLVLGCTEFSVALRGSSAKKIIDPLKIAAQDMTMKFLSQQEHLKSTVLF